MCLSGMKAIECFNGLASPTSPEVSALALMQSAGPSEEPHRLSGLVLHQLRHETMCIILHTINAVV